MLNAKKNCMLHSYTHHQLPHLIRKIKVNAEQCMEKPKVTCKFRLSEKLKVALGLKYKDNRDMKHKLSCISALRKEQLQIADYLSTQRQLNS